MGRPAYVQLTAMQRTGNDMKLEGQVKGALGTLTHQCFEGPVSLLHLLQENRPGTSSAASC